MRAVVWLLTFLICISANAAVKSSWLLYNAQAEKALCARNVRSARKDLVEALLAVEKSVSVSSADVDLKKLFSNVETWKQANEKKIKEYSEVENKRQQSEAVQQQKRNMLEMKAKDGRWQTAKARGKTYQQFDREEQMRLEHSRPEKLAKFQKSLGEGRLLIIRQIPITKEHLEILKLAASVRESVYGPKDSVALQYEKDAVI